MDEWEVLRSICIRDPEQEPDAARLTAALATAGWGELLEQAIRHKVTPLLVAELLKAVPDCIPQQIRIHLRTVLAANTYRSRLLRRTVVEIQREFDARGVRGCPVKGGVFELSIYREPGTRLMNDIDFMVEPDDLDQARAALQTRGFTVGEFDPDTVSVRPYSRRELVFYRLNPDHLPIMTRLTGDLVVPAVRVDVAYNLTWANAPWQLPAQEALRELDELTAPEGDRIRCMQPEYQFAHTALHLFREAWLERWLETGQDVNLLKFADLYRLWYTHEELLRARMPALLASSSIKAPIAWVLAHADRTFDSALVAALGLEPFLNEEFLCTVCGADGKELAWNGDMAQRLRAKDRGYVFDRA